MLPDHLFVASDGTLYDTRQPDWSRKPIRAVYRRHGKIRNTQEFKAALRAGKWTDLGSYPVYFVLDDGEALSFEAARENLREILYDMTHDVTGSGSWNVIGLEVNYEDSELCCAHTGKKIEAAYV